MFLYDLPSEPVPDYKIYFSATHADAFKRASKAALRFMEMEGQSNEALGVLKSPKAYMAGKMDFENNIITDPAPVEEYGAGQPQLQERQIVVRELRAQLTGHLRVAMSSLLNCLRISSAYLVFYRGGALVIISSSKAHSPYRIGHIHMENATNVEQELACVSVNSSSLRAYKALWHRLDDARRKYEAETAAKDVLDEEDEALANSAYPAQTLTHTAPAGPFVSATTSPHVPVGDMDDEEDQIDRMSEFQAPVGFDDEEEEPGEAPKNGESDDDPPTFDVDMDVPF